MFFLDYGGQQKVMTEPQTVTVAVGGAVVDTFQVGATGDVRRIPLTVNQLGTGDQVSVQLSVDRTFVPAMLSAWSAARSARAGAVRLPCLRRNAVARPCRRAAGAASRAGRPSLAALTALALELLGGVAGGRTRLPRAAVGR